MGLFKDWSSNPGMGKWKDIKQGVGNFFKSPLGKIVGFAAMVAVPFAAPYAMTAMAGTAWGSALMSLAPSFGVAMGATSAALGAGVGAITGAGWERGAIMGGLGGYSRALGFGGPAGGPAVRDAYGASGAPAAGTAGTTGAAGVGAAPTVANIPASPGAAGNTVLGPNATVTPTGVTTTNPTIGQQASNVLRNASTTLKNKVTDPNFLADITLRAAGSLASGALAGDGLTPEEQEFMKAQMADLQLLRQNNQSLYEDRLRHAHDLIAWADQFDPEYYGLQGARRAGLQGAAIRQEATRGRTGTNRQAEARRADLGTARNMGTGFDVGYATGVDARTKVLTAGINAHPTDYPSTAYEAQVPWGMFQTANQRRKDAAGEIAGLFELATDRNKNSEYSRAFSANTPAAAGVQNFGEGFNADAARRALFAQ